MWRVIFVLFVDWLKIVILFGLLLNLLLKKYLNNIILMIVIVW